MKKDFNPFGNEDQVFTIGGSNELMIENREDRVSIFGTVDLTRDKEGIKKARILKQIIDKIVLTLENENLPLKITIEKPEVVKNPFR